MPAGGTGAGIDRESDRDFPVAIAITPASHEQRRLAVYVVAVLATVAIIVAPFAATPLPRIDNFVPVLQTVLAVADLITAILLLAQFRVLPQRALLAVASAYLCSASYAFLQTLTFPGAYGPQGLFGDGPNTPAWLFVLWHATFPLGILVYALMKDRRESTNPSVGTATTAMILTVVAVFIAVGVTTWFVSAHVGSLPAFYEDSIIRQTNLGNQANVGLLLWYCIALAVLVARGRTMLDIWLIVVLMAWLPNFLVAALASSVRFSLGWYAGRGFALIASFMLLCVLLTEMTVLYSRIANAFSLLRRERANRLMSVDAATAAIAHEVRGPLGAITLNASAALTQLRTPSPRFEEIEAILSDIEADSLRVDDVIAGTRSLFKMTTGSRGPAELGDIARRSLALSEPDLLNSAVSVVTDFQDDHVPVYADQIQLQQVILNLIRNAIDAMSSVGSDARLLRLTTRVSGSTVLLSVADTGAGIVAGDNDLIFEAFFTTKRSGLGLGLAISRTIVESHGGSLRLARSGPDGSVFELSLTRYGD